MGLRWGCDGAPRLGLSMRLPMGLPMGLPDIPAPPPSAIAEAPAAFNYLIIQEGGHGGGFAGRLVTEK
jgi:hypothetical protein